MKWEMMEILSPASYSSWFFNEVVKTPNWTHEENKRFENALAVHDKDTPDRWQKVASMIPGKTIDDVRSHYKDLVDDVSDIEAGLIPIPGYGTCPFTLEWVNGSGFDGLKSPTFAVGGKRSGARPDQERKKGVPWTEEEHRLFLMGLKKYGKGDWRNISRNFVMSRTPTQVASHAQKYFIRQFSGGKDKRRASIHDITTVNLTDTKPPSPPQSNTSLRSSSVSAPKISEHFSLFYDPNQPNEGAMALSAAFSQANRNNLINPTFGITSYGMKLQEQNLLRSMLHETKVAPPQNIGYHPQVSRQRHQG
ncbi:hypothetical protein AAC387_Pa07g3902 [Persea americana]|eukprot:TRINITY_DN12471_c0_g1_i2.p1 TRINITY_DN12471_c0_g1~~TRINITY_DN12471_c0_g1_i2.p1  ORF type:complete len:307 (+),score=45.68 TRINITY_DN12471_c0_g1_i2:294-1214(+)